MNELIKITNQNGIETVNARELHAFLEVGRDFSTWIKSRIEKYNFIENLDFVSLPQIGEREIGATKRIDYYLSIDMAKELSMIENNEKGRQARRYFIECEKKLKQPLALPAAIENKLTQIEKTIDSIHESLQGEVMDEPRSFRSTCGCSVYQYEKKIDELHKLVRERNKEVNRMHSFQLELKEAFRYILYEAKDLYSVKKTAEKAYEELNRSHCGFYICF